MKQKVLFSISFILVFLGLMGCSDNGITNPMVSPDQEQVLQTVAKDQCDHNRILFRGDPAAEITSASSGTYYQCMVGEVHTAAGGDNVYSDHWVQNVDGNEYTLELFAGNLYVFAAPTTVFIANPVNVEYLNSAGEWVAVTGDTYVTTTQIKVNDGGSALLTTTERVELRSGHNDN
ncbi:MAG: hypothetical protein ACE5EE_09160 [Fidelibacterota bacterium]